VIEAMGMYSVAEVGRRILMYSPLAAVPATVAWGLWRRRRWARRGALGINWVVLAALVVGLIGFGWDYGVRAPLYFAPLAAPVIVIACLQAYFLTRPAVKALFEVPSGRTEVTPSPSMPDVPALTARLSAKRHVRWLTLGLVVALIGVSVAITWRGNVDIRYHDADLWAEQAGDRVPAGLTSKRRWFFILDDQLHLASSPTAPPETSIALRNELLNSRFWRVTESADGNRFVCVNERGLAVWRTSGAHELMHSWAITSEPMAGPRVGRFIDGSIEYDRHKLVLAFRESPDGRPACIHVVGQTAFASGDPRDGVVIVRDLETGRDVARLVHPDAGLRVDLVAWSGDSQRLATYGEDNTLRVWEIDSGAPCASLTTDVDWFALSHDGTVLFTSKLRRDVRPLSATLTARRVADGSVIQRREVEWLRWATLSPDGLMYSHWKMSARPVPMPRVANTRSERAAHMMRYRFIAVLRPLKLVRE
jgi:hypothetical protein